LENDPARPKSTAEKLLGPLGKGLTITGGASLRLMQNSVAGGQAGSQAYYDQNLSNQDYRSSVGGMQQTEDLTIQGRVFNAFDVNARLSNSKYGNQFDQVFSFNYKNRSDTTELGIGNLNKTLPGNELVTFSRSFQGVTFKRDFGGGKDVGQGLVSLTRAVTKRGSIRGNGTTGPYFLNASNIVEGTDHVRLNGQDLTAGKDYKIDYLLGQIQFTTPIKPEDTVEFTYESRNYSTTPGLLTGVRWDFHDDKGNAYGITYLSQKSQGPHIYNGNIEERFPVIADPSYKYTLSSLIDPAYPVTIQWNNRLLIEGVDYYLNRQLRYFQLLTASLPPDTSVTGQTSLTATYRPLQQNSIAGDRAVMGLDSTLRVAPNGNVGIQFGSSSAETSSQTGRGLILSTNWQAPGSSTHNRWQFTAGYRDIGDSFSTIDSTAGAFLQAEKGVRAAFNYSPNPLYTFTSSLTRSEVANRSLAVTTGGVTTAPVWATNESLNAGVNVNLRTLPISFQHRQTVQGSGGSSNTQNTFMTDEVRASWVASKILTLSSLLTQTTTHGRSVFASAYNNSVPNNGAQTGSTIIDQLQDATNQSTSDSTSTSSSLQATLTPAAWVSLTGNIGFTNLKSSTGTSGGGSSSGTSSVTSTSNNNSSTSGSRARSTGLGLTLMPVRGMNIVGNFSESSNGQSLQEYYNPGSGGTSTIIPTNTTGQKTRSTSFGMQYVPFERLQLGANVNHTLSLVPGYDNTQSDSADFMVNTIVARWMQLNFSHVQQSVTYVGGQGDSHNKSMTVSALIGPFGRMTFNSALTRMDFGSAVYTGSSGSGLTGGSAGGYDSGSGSGSTSGNSYLQNGENLSWVVEGNYNIGRRQALVGTWRMIDQSAPTSGSSSANTGVRAGTDFWQGTASLGYDLRLNEIMGFRVDFNLIKMVDRQDSRYSYRARTVTGNLTARF
jgi:hypothetical protein